MGIQFMVSSIVYAVVAGQEYRNKLPSIKVARYDLICPSYASVQI